MRASLWRRWAVWSILPALAVGALLLSIWQGEWLSLRSSPMVPIPWRFEEVHVEQQPWRLDALAPRARARTIFAAYGPNVVRQAFRCPADNLDRLSLWMAGPAGQQVKATLSDTAADLYYEAHYTIVDPSGRTVQFTFPPLPECKGRVFSLAVSAPGATSEGAILLRAAPGDRLGGSARMNLYPVPVNLDLAAYHRGLPGKWWLDAIGERLVPTAFRTRLAQYKPDWVRTGTFGWLVVVGLLCAGLALAVGPWWKQSLKLMSVGGATLALYCAVSSLWVRFSGTQVEMGEPLDMPTPWSLPSERQVAFDMLMNLDGAIRDLTRERDRGYAYPEVQWQAQGPRPALHLAGGYPLAWWLQVPPGAVFRTVLAPAKEGSRFELWVTEDRGRSNLLRQQVGASDAGGQEIEVDLGQFAGQRVRLELLCAGGDGSWISPRILTDGAWLLPYPLVSGAPGRTWRAEVPRFGEAIQLLGYTLDKVTFHPGERLQLDLYWHALGDVEVNYTVFVHLLDETGAYVEGHDSWPVSGFFPTTLWTPDFVVLDVRELSLPADLPPGSYRLQVGLYDLATLVRLPALGPDGQRLAGDALPLQEQIVVRVEP